MESSLSGTVKVEDAEIATPEGTIVGRLRRGQAALKDFTLSERRIRLDEMELDGLYLRVSRDKAGRIDWVDWLSGTDANPENLSPETPFVVEGADLILRNSDFTWVDASLADTQQIEITGVDGRIAEYSTRPGARTAMRLSFGISTEGVLAVDGEGNLTLLEPGREIAERIYSRHRLLTHFFMQLGVDEKTAAEDACKAEHILSEQTLEKIRESALRTDAAAQEDE